MELLKKLFAIHSKSGKEGKMKRFIWNWVKHYCSLFLICWLLIVIGHKKRGTPRFK